MPKPTIPIHIGWSSNSKTGHIPVSTTGSVTCPDTCQHKKLKTCYADYSFLGTHWRKVDSGERDIGWSNFLQFIRDLPSGQLWRGNQAGDLPGVNKRIDSKFLLQMVEANRGKRGFTYTHKPLIPKNLDLIHYANDNGLTINVSCDSLPAALIIQQKLQMLGYIIPVVVTVPLDYAQMDDNVKICPAQIRSDITCIKCQWCAIPNRKFIVAFLVHGCRKNSWE